jgi:hypothetical protein
MARQLTDVDGVAKLLYFLDEEGKPDRRKVYKLVRRDHDPLPHRKIGKHLRFDVSRVWAWIDGQPGADERLAEDMGSNGGKGNA